MISFEILWNNLDIQVLLITSLSLQILLVALTSFRKHVISYRWAPTTNKTWRGPLALMFHLVLWLAYNMSDYVAIGSLVYLLVSEINHVWHHNIHYLQIFWAPFFLLHSGGHDNITALSVEDNELWLRHLLTMLFVVVLVMFCLSSYLQDALWQPAALIFALAIFKNVERIWSLQRATLSALRNSMITKPDPGPNYVKLMMEYTSSAAIMKVEVPKHTADPEMQKTKEGVDILYKSYADVVCKAYKFFPIFKRLFVDLILSNKAREDSQKYFEVLQTEDAYKLIEIELSWMYEILHSRGSVIYSSKHYGWISRVVTLFITTVALCLFVMSDHNGYERIETYLTYVLLGSALGLEIIALAFILLSSWTYATMKECSIFSHFSNFLFSIKKITMPKKKPRWSNRMAQYSLITYSLDDKPCWWKSILICLGLKDTWDHYRFTTCVTVNEYLKEFVFGELKKKMNNIDDNAASYRRFTDHRGQWALQRKGYYQEFGWSVDAEFDESILLWHIATDLLFHDNENSKCTMEEQKPESQPEEKHQQEKVGNREISQEISNYMLFLLIMRPFLMPAGIGQIRFGDTCAEAANFFQPLGDIEKGYTKKRDAVRRILEVNTDYDPVLIKGDRSKSVLFKGCMLAHQLKKEFKTTENGEQDWDKMWRLISVVWVEMLCYAAKNCSGQFHAKQLSKGGELLTVIWFLMAHLGMGENFRIEKGGAHAKVIVTK